MPDFLFHFIGNQPERQWQGLCRLRIFRIDSGFIIEKLTVEFILYAVGEFPVMLRQPLVITEDLRIIGQLPAHPIIAGSRCLRDRRQIRSLAVGIGIEIEPIPQRPRDDMILGRRA